MTTTTLEPIEKTVEVDMGIDEAFELFTGGIATWWPVKTHSVAGEDAIPFVEPRAGGRIFERAPSGEEHDWGTVVTWEPPARLAFTFHPGRGPQWSTEVEVTFEQAGETTILRLVHKGWEKVSNGSAARAGYFTGWDVVLGYFRPRS